MLASQSNREIASRCSNTVPESVDRVLVSDTPLEGTYVRTVVPWQAIDGRIVELRNDLARCLRAQTRLISIMIHEGYLLRGLVRRVEETLQDRE